jgi:hypothetical protein
MTVSARDGGFDGMNVQPRPKAAMTAVNFEIFCEGRVTERSRRAQAAIASLYATFQPHAPEP